MSVVSGLTGLANQNKAADAQKAALASQEKQAALNAQLQLLNLRNQTMSDRLNDGITDATNRLSYMQSRLQLQADEQLNNMAVANALSEASTSKQLAQEGAESNAINAQGQRAQADLAAGAEALDIFAGASKEEQAGVNSIVDALAKGGDRQSAIAQILSLASTAGGVNEALALLSDDNDYSATAAAASASRAGELTQAQRTGANATRDARQQVNAASTGAATTNANIQALMQTSAADKQMIDANSSQQIANQSFRATNAANDAAYGIGILSNETQRFARNYLSSASEQAIMQGAQLTSDTLRAQSAAIPRAGFFDVLGVGLQGYGAYRGSQRNGQ